MDVIVSDGIHLSRAIEQDGPFRRAHRTRVHAHIIDECMFTSLNRVDRHQ